MKKLISSAVLFSACCLILLDFAFGFALPGKVDIDLDKSRRSFAIPNRGFYNQTQIQLKSNNYVF